MTAPATVAERLYFKTPELKFRARVADIRLVANARGEGGEREQLWEVALDRTAFFPEGGGQPFDTGILRARARSGAVLEAPVESVQEDEAGEVWHRVRKPLVQGTEVEGKVDAERRMDHMQQHSGQHLLSAVFLAEQGARTVSFHLGEQNATIDLQLPPGVEALTTDQVAAVEAEANRRIAANHPVRSHWYNRAEAERMSAEGKLRKLPERPGVLRVVEIEDVEWNACGGTHVAATGSIGCILLRRLEKVKQGWRVEFVCGLRAVRLARRENEVLMRSATLFSTAWEEVPTRVLAMQEESRRLGKERQELQRELATAQAAWLDAGTPAAEIVVTHLVREGPEFATSVAAELRKRGRGAVLSFDDRGEASSSAPGQGGGLVLLRRPGTALDAGRTVQTLVQAETGLRGGGSAEMARLLGPGSAIAAVRDRVVRLVRGGGEGKDAQGNTGTLRGSLP